MGVKDFSNNGERIQIGISPQREIDLHSERYRWMAESALVGVENTNRFVVDVGCGMGYLNKYLFKVCNDIKVISMDVDAALIAHQKAFNKDTRVVFAEGDIMSFYKYEADIIICGGVIEHVEEPQAFFKAVDESGCKTFVGFYPYMEDDRNSHHIHTRLTPAFVHDAVKGFKNFHCVYQTLSDNTFVPHPQPEGSNRTINYMFAFYR